MWKSLAVVGGFVLHVRLEVNELQVGRLDRPFVDLRNELDRLVFLVGEEFGRTVDGRDAFGSFLFLVELRIVGEVDRSFRQGGHWLLRCQVLHRCVESLVPSLVDLESLRDVVEPVWLAREKLLDKSLCVLLEVHCRPAG